MTPEDPKPVPAAAMHVPEAAPLVPAAATLVPEAAPLAPPAAQLVAEAAGLTIPPRVRRAILFGAVVTTVAGTLGTAFLPYLLVQHPLVLLLSSSDGRNIVLVAPQVDLPTLLLIAVPRRTLAMAVTYGLGVLYGRAMLAWSARKLPRLSRFLVQLEHLFVRFQRTLLVVVPTYTTSALAGVTRTPLPHFMVCMLLGQVAYVTVSYSLGAALTQWIDRLIQLISPYLWESTAACVAFVSLQQLVSFVRRRRASRRAELSAAANPER